jgi:hypothetical protein
MPNIDSLKITDNDVLTYGVRSAPTRPEGTAQENKYIFDRALNELVMPHWNALIDALKQKSGTDINPSGADNIGCQGISGLAGGADGTTREMLIRLYNQILDISQGGVADGSITSAKLADDATMLSLLTDYVKAASESALASTDTIAAALGKLEKAIELRATLASPAFTGAVKVADGNFTDFPLAKVVAGTDSGHTFAGNIGIIGETVSGGADTYGVGVGGVCKGSTDNLSIGVFGRALPNASSDTVDCRGVQGTATATHAGGKNIGVFGSASGGATNYSFYGTENMNLTAGKKYLIDDVDVLALKADVTSVSAIEVYDKVVKTQSEFEALIASATWLDSVSVAFVGQFTYSVASNSGIKIPDTVKQIHGYNDAKITITNFLFSPTDAKGGLWYDTLPTTNDYSICDLEVDCTGNRGYGFRNCTNLMNCTGTGTGTGAGYGFADCTSLTNCTGTGTGGSFGYGFSNCTNLTNCTGTGTGTDTGTGAGYGFLVCTNLTNCTGTGTGTWAGYGFYDCTNLTNCTGAGTGGTNGYGFFDIINASNCLDGGYSTAMWGGTNTNIDLDTCRKTPVAADNTTLNT